MGATISPSPCHQRPSGGLFLGIDQLNLVNGVWTIVLLDTVADLGNANDGIEDTGTNRITPGVPGLYLMIGQVCFLNLVIDKQYQAAILVNGLRKIVAQGHASHVNNLSVLLTGLRWLTQTDYIQLQAVSGSGDDTVDIEADYFSTFLHLQRIR